MKSMNRWLPATVKGLLSTALLAGAIAAATPAPALAQDEPTPPAEDATPNVSTEDERPAEATPEEDREELLAVTGGIVHTVSGPTLRDVTILVRDGVIEAIGPNVNVPEDATTIDASGYHVYPGLIAVESSGIVGGGNPADTTDVFNLSMDLALAAGVTTAVTGNTAAKLTRGTVEGIVLKDDLFHRLRYSSSSPAQKRRTRQDFERLREHLREMQRYEREKGRNPDAEKPDDKWIRGQLDDFLKLMRGEKVAIADANTAHELLEVADLASTYGFPLVIRGGVEAWTVAPQLSRAGVDLIVTPRDRVDPNEDLMRPNGSTIENAAILHEHGIRVAFVPVGSWFGRGGGISLGGLAGRDLQHLAMEAAFGVRGGLSNEAAVRGLTLDAARILRVDDRVGSIEVGKDADFVITDGDLLHYMTQPRWTIVNGRIAYDKLENTLFSHIRPEGRGSENEPADDYWPRRLGDPVGTPGDAAKAEGDGAGEDATGETEAGDDGEER